jgi:hypothetical protein
MRAAYITLATKMVSVVVTTFASVAVALLTLKLRSLLLRESLVIAVAYVAAYAANRIPVLLAGADDQTSSWAPLLMDTSFYIGAVLGSTALFVSYWLIKPRGPRGS